MRKRLFAVLSILGLAALVSAQTATSPNNALAQLGVRGVTDVGGSIVYSNMLIKTRPDGTLAASFVSNISPVVINQTRWLDASNGSDAAGTGTASSPYRTLTNALQKVQNNSVLIFAPGSYAPPAGYVGSNVTNVVLWGYSPSNTFITGILLFNHPAVVDVHNISVAEIRQDDYFTLAVGLYDQAVVGAITRVAYGAANYLTIWREAGATLTTIPGGSNQLVRLTHALTNMAYTATTPADWWTNGTYGGLPSNGQVAVDMLAARSFTAPGTTNGQVAYWNGTNWTASQAGTTNQWLRGGPDPLFTNLEARLVLYPEANVTNWPEQSPTNLQAAVDILAARPTAPTGVATGDMARWSGTNWTLIAAGDETKVLRGGTNPTWVSWFPVPAGVSTGDMVRWSGTNWDRLPAGDELTVLRGGTNPTFVAFTSFSNQLPVATMAGDMARWATGTWAGPIYTTGRWVRIPAGTSTQVLVGGTGPVWTAWYPMPVGVSSGELARWVSPYWDGGDYVTGHWDIVQAGGSTQVLFGGQVPAFGNFRWGLVSGTLTDQTDLTNYVVGMAAGQAATALWASNGVVTLQGRTSTWNQASANASWASNTANWASNTANWASNGVVVLQGVGVTNNGTATLGLTLNADLNCAGYSVTNASDVTITNQAFKFAETADDNMGLESVTYPVTGQVNSVWMGWGALYDAPGSYNNAIGYQSLYGSPGSGNSAFGYRSGFLAGGVSGDYNSTFGYRSGYLSGGTSNVLIGANAGYSVGSITNAIAIGAGAVPLGNNSMVLGNDGTITTEIKGNIGIGTNTPATKLHIEGGGLRQSAEGIVFSETADDNMGLESATYPIGSSQINSTWLGYGALYESPGSANNAMGYQALYQSAGSQNNAIGYRAGYQSSGSWNFSGGHLAHFQSPGSYNAAIGDYSLAGAPGDENSALGYRAGFSVAGSSNVFIGAHAGAFAGSMTNAIVIGARAVPLGNNSMVLGNAATVTTKIEGTRLITGGTTFLFYASSTNYVAMWADQSAYYVQAVSNGVAGIGVVRTNTLFP